MNYKTIKTGLKTAGLTLAGIALGYLPFVNTANAGSEVVKQPDSPYKQLIDEVKKRSGLTMPIIIVDGQGRKVQEIPRYRCSGYNEDLEGQVGFEYSDLRGGMLTTEIPNSPFVPKFNHEGNTSRLYHLIVVEGTGQPIDGNPEGVAVEESTRIEMPDGVTEVTIRRKPLEEYKTDPSIKASINRDYLTALRKTKLY